MCNGKALSKKARYSRDLQDLEIYKQQRNCTLNTLRESRQTLFNIAVLQKAVKAIGAKSTTFSSTSNGSTHADTAQGVKLNYSTTPATTTGALSSLDDAEIYSLHIALPQVKNTRTKLYHKFQAAWQYRRCAWKYKLVRLSYVSCNMCTCTLPPHPLYHKAIGLT